MSQLFYISLVLAPILFVVVKDLQKVKKRIFALQKLVDEETPVQDKQLESANTILYGLFMICILFIGWNLLEMIVGWIGGN